MQRAKGSSSTAFRTKFCNVKKKNVDQLRLKFSNDSVLLKKSIGREHVSTCSCLQMARASKDIDPSVGKTSVIL